MRYSSVPLSPEWDRTKRLQEYKFELGHNTTLVTWSRPQANRSHALLELRGVSALARSLGTTTTTQETTNLTRRRTTPLIARAIRRARRRRIPSRDPLRGPSVDPLQDLLTVDTQLILTDLMGSRSRRTSKQARPTLPVPPRRLRPLRTTPLPLLPPWPLYLSPSHLAFQKALRRFCCH